MPQLAVVIVQLLWLADIRHVTLGTQLNSMSFLESYKNKITFLAWLYEDKGELN